jgi:hypothetical protein
MRDFSIYRDRCFLILDFDHIDFGKIAFYIALNAGIMPALDTDARWHEVDPILHLNKMAIDLDFGSIKIGDGVRKWSEIQPTKAFNKKI